MEKLVKNGQIILDGTEPKYAKIKKICENYEVFQNIEEELGISLVTLVNVLKKGIAYTTKKGKVGYRLPEELILDLENLCFKSLEQNEDDDGNEWVDLTDEHFYFEDFGVHWEILTKEKYEEARKNIGYYYYDF